MASSKIFSFRWSWQYINLLRKDIYLKMLSFKLLKSFSSQAVHTPICIIGAGAGGVCLLGHLSRQKGFLPQNIRVFDPAQFHHYQPGWTMVAAGLCSPENFSADTAKLIAKGVPFQRSKVTLIDPVQSRIYTEDNKEFTYEHLVLSTGIRVDFNRIPGKNVSFLHF